MRRANSYGLAAAAALALAPAPAAAQMDWSTPFSPKPAPDSDAEWVPATPETMGVTPEQFQRMNVAKDARLPNRPSRKSDGFAQYETPVALAGPAQGPVALAPGAVVASAAVRIDPRRWVLKAPIAVGAPFNFTVPAGTAFGGSLDENGDGRPCLTPRPYETFTPPHDENDEGYPSLCLIGMNLAGGYATARLYPYFTDGAKLRDVAIAPAMLEPVAPGASHPNFSPYLAIRRLRVDAVTADSATIVLEMAFDKRLEEHGRRDPFVELKDFRQVGSFELPLRDGAQVAASGVTLTLRKAPSGWTVEPSGAFTPWADISPDATGIRLGEYNFPRRVR